MKKITVLEHLKKLALAAMNYVDDIMFRLTFVVNENIKQLSSTVEDIQKRILPPGGVEGQTLIKKSGSDYDVGWGGYVSNDNILINSYFIGGGQFPINQLGKSIYNEEHKSNVRCIDRWIAGAAVSVELTAFGLRINRNGPSGSSIIQRVEKDAIPLDTVITYSILLADNILLTVTGKTPDSFPENGFKAFLSANNIGACSCYIFPDYWQFTIGTDKDNTSIMVEAAKLELGPVQTLAHKEGDVWVLNSPPPNPALELMKCQRYQIVIPRNLDVPGRVATDAASAYIFIPLPVTPRANGTISITKAIAVSEKGYITINNITSTAHAVKTGVFVLFSADFSSYGARTIFILNIDDCIIDFNL